jgi:hypothetical protein
VLAVAVRCKLWEASYARSDSRSEFLPERGFDAVGGYFAVSDAFISFLSAGSCFNE